MFAESYKMAEKPELKEEDLQLDLYPKSRQPASVSEEILGRLLNLNALEGEEYEVELSSLIADMNVMFVLKQEVVQSAGPGSPLFALAQQNGKLIAENGEEICRMVVQRMSLMILAGDVSRLTPVQLIEKGLADPVKVFIKKEPHLKTKIQEGRLRIICSLSIVSNTIARIMYSVQNNTEIANWNNGKLPSMSGFGGTEVRDVSYLAALWASKKNLAQTDMRGWDWSIQDWQLEADAIRRARLCNAGPLFTGLIHTEHQIMARKVFLLSDGRLFAQTFPGIMPSGWYLTTSTNSFIRAMMCRMIGAVFYRVMGDDSVEDYVEGAVDKYAKYGHRVKLYERCERAVEFCSREWKGHTTKLVTWVRALYRLLSDEPAQDRYEQFKMDLRDNDELLDIIRDLKSVGWGGQTDLAKNGANSKTLNPLN